MPKYLRPRRPDSQIGICQRSGQKMYRSDMVEDGMVKGLLVHPDWWEEYHPQLLPPPMRPDGLPKRRPAPDDTFPMQPGVLTGTAGDGGIELTWTPFGLAGSGSQIEAYNVWRSTNSGESFSLLATLPVTPTVIITTPQAEFKEPFEYEQPFVDATAQNGYQYYVQGVQIHGQSTVSNTVTASLVATTFDIIIGGNLGEFFGYDNTNLGPFGSITTGGLSPYGTIVQVVAQEGEDLAPRLIINNTVAPPQNAFTTFTLIDTNGSHIVRLSSSAQYSANGGQASWTWFGGLPAGTIGGTWVISFA
jgi:hypothetical protein